MDGDVQAALLLSLVLVSALVLGLLGLVVFSDDAAAQEEPSMLDQVTDATDDAFWEGIQGRIAGWLNARWNYATGEQVSATEACGDLQATFNDHNETIQSYVNARTNASADTDVLAITCVPNEDDDDASEAVFLTADVTANGTYANASIVDSTDRTADANCVLEEDAAVNAADELATFVEEFAEPGDDLSADFRTRLVSQYAGDVHCDGVPGVSG
jgi:hypothetical protein